MHAHQDQTVRRYTSKYEARDSWAETSWTGLACRNHLVMVRTSSSSNKFAMPLESPTRGSGSLRAVLRAGRSSQASPVSRSSPSSPFGKQGARLFHPKAATAALPSPFSSALSQSSSRGRLVPMGANSTLHKPVALAPVAVGLNRHNDYAITLLPAHYAPAPSMAPPLSMAPAPSMTPLQPSKIPIRRYDSAGGLGSRHGSSASLTSLKPPAAAPPAPAPPQPQAPAAAPAAAVEELSEEELAEGAVQVADMLNLDLTDPACFNKAGEALRAHESGPFEPRFDARQVRRFLSALAAASHERGVAPDALWRALDALERC